MYILITLAAAAAMLIVSAGSTLLGMRIGDALRKKSEAKRAARNHNDIKLKKEG